MSWLTENTDLIGIVLAFVAILLSLTTVQLARRQQQMTAFLQIQEAMLSTDLQHGRRLVYRIGEGAVPPTGGTDELNAIARALAMFNVLGTYTRRGIIPRRWVLDFWHKRLRALRPGLTEVVAQRVQWSNGQAPWPDLLDLVERAENYTCSRRCCSPVAQP
jgi:hypothetical protein